MPGSLRYAIDFGTSNSLLSISDQGRAGEPISLDPLHEDPSILRSLMYFPKVGEPSFGIEAVESYTRESGEGRFIRSIKKYLPAKSFQGTQISGRVYGLEQLISRFLREMKLRADRKSGKDVTSVVIGKPARFSMEDDREALAIQRLEAAARLAGFVEVQFLEEPLAAAFSYKKLIQGEKKLLVVDLGGGTSDFTVIKLHQGQFQQSDVLSIGGISVAGDALDGSMMAEIIAPHFGSKVQYQFPMSRNVLTMPPVLKKRLSNPADITLMGRSDIMAFLAQVKKCNISNEAEAQLEQLDFLIRDNLGFSIFSAIENSKIEVCVSESSQFEFNTDEISISEPISYLQFSEVVAASISSIFACLDETLKKSGLTSDQIDFICMTGGTSKVPLIKQGLSARFGEEKVANFRNFHSVIMGLAQQAAI